MIKASLAWLPCAHRQDDGSTRYAVIELTDDRLANPIILQIPEHLYSMGGGNAVLQGVLTDVVAKINRREVVVPLRPELAEHRVS